MGGVIGGGASMNTPLVPFSNRATAMGVLGGVSTGGSSSGIIPTVGSLTSLSLPSHTKLSMGSAHQRSSQQQQSHHSVLSAGHLAQSSGALVGNMILQQQQHVQHLAAAMRPLNQPTVVASPLKIPVSQLPQSVQHNLTTLGVAGGGASGDLGRLGTSGGSSSNSGSSSSGSSTSREVKGSLSGERGGGPQSGKEEEEKGSGREVGGTGAPVGVAVIASDVSPPKRTRLSRKAAASSAGSTDNSGN